MIDDNTTAIRGHQAWQNECNILFHEKVKVVIRAPQSTNMGVSYKELHPVPLSYDAPFRYLRDRIDQFRHALNSDQPFYVEIVDGSGSTQFPDKYKTVGDLRASYANPGRI